MKWRNTGKDISKSYNNSMKRKLLYWTPRILSILFVLLLSLFALDVFGKYQGLAVIPALFMHLLIPLAVALVTIAAWKWNWIGAIAFFSFAVYYVWMVGLDRDWTWYATIAGPAVIIGILFLFDWISGRGRMK